MNRLRILTTLALLTSLFCVNVNAQDNDNGSEQFKDAEKRLKEYCDIGHGYQPGWPDILSAIDILETNAKISACTLYKKMGLTHRHNLYVRGFRQLESGGNEFTYEVVDFTSGKPVSQDCVATSHYESVPGGSWDARQEIFDVVCKPGKD